MPPRRRSPPPLVAGRLLALLVTPEAAAPQARTILLATTTSTQDSGLLDVLVPLFEKKTGHTVKTIAVGTGRSLALGGRGGRGPLPGSARAAPSRGGARRTGAP